MTNEQINYLKNYSADYLQTLESVIENLPIPVSVVGADEQFALVNSAYETMFDVCREMLLGKHFSCHLKEGEDSIHRRVLQQKAPASGIKIMGNSQRLVKVVGVPILADDSVVFSLAVIYEFSTTERAMSEFERRREAMSEVKSEQARYRFEDIVGSSAVLKKTIETAKKAAETNVTILLRGESGTGKELFAHAIHNESRRRGQKFICVNCAAIPESLLESILFGYEGGAFTGAKRTGEIGLFEAAGNGTVFLDEIGDISPSLQSKLLRVLQEREITRVGGTTVHPIHARIIAATNADLEAKIARKEFRSDLYYRLNRFPVYIPALRERAGDVAELAYYFLRRYAVEFGKNVREIDERCLKVLNHHAWSGNVRELDNTIARSVISLDEERTSLDADSIRFFLTQDETAPDETEEVCSGAAVAETEDEGSASYQQRFEQWESQMLRALYLEENKVKARVARRLNLSVRSVYEKLKKYNIE